jgi:hypothetical protein
MSLVSDLAAYRAFASEFEAYLKSETMFYNVGGSLPALTIGGLLYLRRVLAVRHHELSPTERNEYEKADDQISQVLNRWASNVERKALKEISSRLNIWRSALEDLGDDYVGSVHQRVYLELLMSLVSRLPESEKYRQRLATLDTLLRNKILPAEFILDPAISSAFPPHEFWFLYRKPRK